MIAVSATCVLLLSMVLLCVRRMAVVLCLGALQSLCAAAALAAGGKVELAGLAVALNGVALPLTLWWIAEPATLGVRISTRALWAVALVAIAACTAVPVTLSLAIGVAVVLLGFLFVARSPERIAHVVGLASAQNGLVLVASSIPYLPLPAGLVIAIPFVPGLVLADRRLHR